MTEQQADTQFNREPGYAWEEIPAETPPAILAALGGPEANRVAPGREAARVVPAGVRLPWPTPGEVVLEDGSRRTVHDSLPGDLPLGYHDFFPSADNWRTRVIVTPWQCAKRRRGLGAGPCNSTARGRNGAGASATWPI